MNGKERKSTSEIFEIQSKESFLKFYRTSTALTSSSLQPSFTVIKETPFLLVPSIHTFTIYNLQDLKTQFISVTFPNISCIVQSGVFIYVASENWVYKTLRGMIISKIRIENVSEMIKFGNYLVLNTKNQLIILECEDNSSNYETSEFLIKETDNNHEIQEKSSFNELYRLSYETKVKMILHPNTYVNKILIVFENGTAELFNLSSQKSIFKYEFGKVSCISQTDILDIVAIGMADGSVKIYNLKKNRLLFTIQDFIGSPVKYLSFKGNFASIITNNCYIYNLELKKEVHTRENCYFALIINESTALFTTKNSIEVLTLEDFNILKSRKVLNESIQSITSYSKTDLLLSSQDQVFKMNIYRDEMNRFLKVKGTVEQLSIDDTGRVRLRSSSLINNNVDSNPLFNSNILLYGENQLSYIDRDLKWHNFIHMKCRFIKVFKDFCLLGSNTQVLVMNIKSKRVICTLKLEIPCSLISGHLENDTFTILTHDKVQTYDFDLNLIFNYDLSSKIESGNISKHENMLFIQSIDSDLLVVSCDSACPISRTFNIQKYAVSSRILIGILNDKIKIFDLPTGTLIDTVDTNKNLIDIAVLDDLKFVAVLDEDSDVHILSNQSHFNAIINSRATGVTKTKLEVPVIRKESNFYKEILVSKNFNTNNTQELENIIKAFNKDESNQILRMIQSNIKEEFYESQKLLSKLLLFKSKELDLEVLSEIQMEVEFKLKEIETKALKAIGYLNLNKNKLI